MEIAEEIDARGLICPLPVLRLRKRLQGLPEGAVVRLLTDDPMAVIDVPHFCAEAGHACLCQSEGQAGPDTGHRSAGSFWLVHLVRRGACRPPF